MQFHDTDDPEQAQALERRLETEGLIDRLLISTFAPDTAQEAANRGFRPYQAD